MADDAVGPYTITLELRDEPGELLRVLEPIAEAGGNLLSVLHERGDLTPRGRVPVEVAFEATASRFEAIVEELRSAGIAVIEAGPDRYDDALTVVLWGHLVESDLSDTIERIESAAGATVADLSLSAPEGVEGESAVRIHVSATGSGTAGAGRAAALSRLRAVAAEKELRLIEPVPEVGR